MSRQLWLSIFCLLFITVAATSSHAATFVVDRTDEANFSACTAAANDCTLRGAINAAAAAGADTIIFDPTIFATRQIITLNGTALPTIRRTGDLTITAPPAGVVIDGNNRSGIFYVIYGDLLTLNRLTLRNGNAGDNSSFNDGGGGIRNEGSSLTINDCTLSNNTGVHGGAIYSDGSLRVYNSTFVGNHASNLGGAIFGNTQWFFLTNCTISRNTASNSGGGIFSIGYPVTLSNTILDSNSAGNVVTGNGGSIISNGYNISSDATGPSSSTDRRNTAPLLDPNGLQDNGGPTQTIALQLSSPAIDTGNSPLMNDQRGVARPSDGNLDGTIRDDVGAFEFDPVQSGANFVVNTLADDDDRVCSGGHCTLREAINAANAQAGADTIIFDAGVFGAPRQTITLGGTRLPSILGNLTITAPDAGLTISGNNLSQIFAINPNVNVTLNGLTIRQGNAGSNKGGGITNLGRLTLLNSTLAANAAAEGGGIYNAGLLALTNCTLSGNSAGQGGGILNFGGGAALTMQSCTLSDNSAEFGGGIYNDSGTVQIGNTILKAGAQGRNLENLNGTLTSQGFNLSSDGSGPNSATDRLNTNPLLGSLADNGGPTPTHALNSDSPAIDAGKSFGLTTDQRGLSRPYDQTHVDNAAGGDGSDIGAVELRALCYALTFDPPNPGTLPNGRAGDSYNQTIAVSGRGAAPYSFQLLRGQGTFPRGLTLSTAGVLSGVPTESGVFGFYFTVTDSNGCINHAYYELTINPSCSTITAQVSGGGTIRPGQTTTVTVTVSGGTAPYTVTLDNGGGTQSGSGPTLNFTVRPTTTTTYSIASVTDSSGCPVTASGSATVTVESAPPVDTTPPTITCPGNQTAVIAATTGPVTYPAPTVSDDRQGVTFSCTPAAGSNFALGTTTVTCTARDAAGNTASCSFTVTVRQLRPAIKDLINKVRALVPPLTTAQVNALIGLLEMANTRLEQGQAAQVCTYVQNFVNAVVSSGRLTTAQAQALTSYANQIRAAIGCGN